MPRLTIIIPHVPPVSVQLLEETILSVLENRDTEVDVLVATAGSYCDPYHLSDEGVDFLTLSRENTAVDCVNAAVAAACDGIACVLFPGTKWGNCDLADVFEAFCNEQVVAAVPGIADQKRKNRVFSSGITCHPSGTIQNHRAGQAILRHAVLAPHLAGAFFRTSALRQWGGLHPQLGLQAAYLDFCFLAAQKKHQTIELPACIFWGTATQKVFTSLFEQAKQSEMLYRLWHHQGNSRQNAKSHAKSVCSEFLSHFPHYRTFQLLTGRMAGRLSGNLSQHRKCVYVRNDAIADASVPQTENAEAETIRFCGYPDNQSDQGDWDQTGDCTRAA